MCKISSKPSQFNLTAFDPVYAEEWTVLLYPSLFEISVHNV